MASKGKHPNASFWVLFTLATLKGETMGAHCELLTDIDLSNHQLYMKEFRKETTAGTIRLFRRSPEAVPSTTTDRRGVETEC